MKGVLLFSLLFAAVCASPSVIGMGNTCDDKSEFVTTNFTISPFPPTAGEVYNVEMDGTFRIALYVANVAVRTSYNGGKYTYKYFDVDQKFAAGQDNAFKFSLTAGNGSGLYTCQVFLEEKQGHGFSCWEYTYHI
jgi:hypothetical protein